MILLIIFWPRTGHLHCMSVIYVHGRMQRQDSFLSLRLYKHVHAGTLQMCKGVRTCRTITMILPPVCSLNDHSTAGPCEEAKREQALESCFSQAFLQPWFPLFVFPCSCLLRRSEARTFLQNSQRRSLNPTHTRCLKKIQSE